MCLLLLIATTAWSTTFSIGWESGTWDSGLADPPTLSFADDVNSLTEEMSSIHYVEALQVPWARAGDYVLKVYGIPPATRSEIAFMASPYQYQPGDDVYFSASFRPDSTWDPVTLYSIIISQWKMFGSPPHAVLRLSNMGDYKLTFHSDLFATADLGVAPPDQWTNIKIYFKKALDASGVIKIWVNGHLKFERNGVNLLLDAGGYTKIGMYTEIRDERILYFDQVELADSIDVPLDEWGQGVPDTSAPSPNPMTFASNPTATSSTTIAMTATEASDASGVEYLFTCTTDAAFSSGWQFHRTYVATGLSPLTTYSFNVSARDLSPNQDQTLNSASRSATTLAAGSDPTNVALNKPAAQSSQWTSWGPERGNDDNLTTYQHTLKTDEPWWQVDLQANYQIASITIKPRTNYFQRASEVYLLISQNPFTHASLADARNDPAVIEAHYQGAVTGDYTVNLANPVARYVRVWMNKNEYLNFAECVVMGTTAGGDIPPPSPNPMTFATNPSATSSSTITMTATTASDPSGVEYLFTCTTDAAFSSSWQDSTSYTATGLSASTTYGFTVKARDKSTNQNETAASPVQSATTGPVTYPPISGNSNYEHIARVQLGSIDNSSAAETDGYGDYTHLSTSIGAGDSVGFTLTPGYASNPYNDGWGIWIDLNNDKDFTDAGEQVFVTSSQSSSAVSGSISIPADTPATVTRMRIVMTYNTNPTSASGDIGNGEAEDYTIEISEGGGDTVPPSPDPMTFASNPAAVDSSTITMTATTASDPSAVEYYFTCTTNAAFNSDWQDSTAYEATGLSPETTYGFTVKARDKSANQNETAPSAVRSATTPSAPPPPFNWANFVYQDNDTQGSWKGTYGIDGFNIARDAELYPSYANVSITGNQIHTWASSTSDVRALEKLDTGRIAACWYANTSFTIDIEITDGYDHLLALYCIDWDSRGREQTFEFRDADTDVLLDSRSITSYVDGTWMIWVVGGHVKVNIIRDGPHNGVISGIFFDPGGDDTMPPTPDPMTFAANPAAVSYSAIAMTATTASDPSGVEYFFTCITDSTFNSAWQDSTSYVATGLDYDTTYSFTVKARDKNPNQNETGASAIQSATTEAPCCDIDPPTPDPMTFASNPTATSSTTITMTATTATDPSGVEYLFTCSTDSAFSSDWQAGTTYVATGLAPSTSYSFTVKARDIDFHNETEASDVASATTHDDDTTPPTPNPMTFAEVPHATGTSTMTMRASTASDPSGVEYYFTCTNAPVFSSGWQENTFYTASGMPAATTYSFTVKARDMSDNHNETQPSAELSATTEPSPPVPNPMTFAVNPTATSSTTVTMTATTATDIDGVEYLFTCTTDSAFNSAWQDSTTYVASGLAPSTSYGFTVSARDKSMYQNQTAASAVQYVTTHEPQPDTTPPSPNPMTFASNPAMVTISTITMTASTATDPSGVEYFFTCTTNSNFNSAWQDSPTYVATGLSPATTYAFTVKARDKSTNQNETQPSAEESASTNPPPDADPPSPDPMTFASNPTATSDSTITMSATTASDVSGVEYLFTCTTNPAFNSNWQDTTTYIASGLSPQTTYSFTVKARDKSSNQNETAASAVQSATTDPGIVTYPSISGSTQYEHIARVQLGSIDNSSGDDGGYGDYTAQSTTIETGSSASFTLTPGFAGSAYNEGWAIWVDLNHDGDFTDSGEQVFVTSSQSNSAVSGSITIPAGTAPVSTRMRIVMKYNSNPSSSTGDIGDGEAEDYTIVISSGAPDTDPPSPDPMTFASNPAATGTTTIAMTASTASDDSGVEYLLTCTTNATFSSSWQDSTSYTATALSASTTYGFTVKARDKSPARNETAASAVQSATTHAEDTTPPTPDPMTFASNPTATSSSVITMTASTASDPSGVEYFFTCTTDSAFNSAWQDSTSYTIGGLSAETTYGFTVKARDKSSNQNETADSTVQSATTDDCCTDYPTIEGSTTYEHIAQVQLGSIDNSSGDDGGYGDYTAQSTSIAAGGSASFTLTPGFAGSSYNEGWSIWIDLNGDGDFTDSGEQVFVTSSLSSSAVTGSITIPAGTTATTTRMRIVMKYNTHPSSSSGDIGDGEAEDYTIVITP